MENRSKDTSPPKQPATPRFWRLLVLSALFGVTSTLVVFFMARSWERQQLETNFQQNTSELATTLKNAIRDKENIVHYLGAFFNASSYVDRSEFHRFSSPLLQERDTLFYLGWAPLVLDSDKSRFIEQANSNDHHQYRIWQMDDAGKAVAANSRARYFPVHYLESNAQNDRFIGFDLASVAELENALEKGSGLPEKIIAQSRRVKYLPETQRMIILNKAVHSRDNTTEAGTLKGFIFIMYGLDDLMKAVESKLSQQHIQVFVKGKQTLNCYPDCNSSEKAGTDNPASLYEKLLDTEAILTAIYPLNMADQQWQIVFTSTDHYFSKRQHLLSSTALIGGLLTTFFMMLYVFSLARRSAQAEIYTQEILSSKTALEYHAKYDALTGLCNRREFESRLNNALNGVKTHQSSHAVLYLDLDQFKIVNDTCGHATGDRLLKKLTERLSAKIRERDTLARLGGDEFALLLDHCTLEDAQVIANSLRETVKKFHFAIENRIFDLGVSIGLVQITPQFDSIERIMSTADMACYMAKDLGRNRVYTYTHDDEEMLRVEGDMGWISKITLALKENRLVLFQQTILPIDPINNQGAHIEILLRMIDENGNLVTPIQFIPAAERFQLMPNIDRQVIKNVIEFYRETPDRLKRINKICINISGQSLSEIDFLNYILACFENSSLPYEKVCFEITETAAISQLDIALKFMSELKAKGSSFALDDFGTGVSSFGYLKEMPIDYIKIDGTFIRDIDNDPIKRSVVKSVVEISKIMQVKTVGEFVENEHILATLKEIGVDYAQGYAIAKPAPLVEL